MSDSSRGVHRWLAPTSLVIVAAAAFMGWAASFIGLHEYGQHTMAGYNQVTAWFIPGAIDGAAFATSLMTYRANILGRAAVRGRILMWGFTAASGWINWVHQPILETKVVAAGLPVAAVAVFDIVLIELRADYEARHGRTAFRLRPGLLMLRWMVDRAGTSAAFRSQITSISVEQLVGLAPRYTAPPVQEVAPTPAGMDTPQLPQAAPVPTPAPEPSTPPTPVSAPAPTRVRLPPPMVATLRRLGTEAAAAGRTLTVDDVQEVIAVDDTTAAQIAADYATTAA